MGVEELGEDDIAVVGAWFVPDGDEDWDSEEGKNKRQDRESHGHPVECLKLGGKAILVGSVCSGWDEGHRAGTVQFFIRQRMTCSTQRTNASMPVSVTGGLVVGA